MKIKTILLTAFLLLSLISGVQAQEKYDFAVVSYDYPKSLSVNYSNKPFQKTEVDKETMKNGQFGPLLHKVAEMQNEGWEVYNSTVFTSSLNNGLPTHLFYLRKKQ